MKRLAFLSLLLLSSCAPAPTTPFVASKSSTTFHLATCESAKRIRRANLVGFDTKADAVAVGLKPCKVCRP